MTWLAVPLYAHAEGLSNAEIGALFAAPVLAQVPLNLAGGAYTDRIGGRRIMLGSCWATGVQGRILGGGLGDGERAAGGARHPAGAPQRGDEHGTDRRHRALRVSPCRSRISAYIPGAG